MIEVDAVLTTANGFVVIEKLKGRQPIRGLTGENILESFKFSDSIGILVETKYQSIVVSPHQRFVMDGEMTIQAQHLSIGKDVLTATGSEQITNITVLDGGHKMANIVSREGTFLANSFYMQESE